MTLDLDVEAETVLIGSKVATDGSGGGNVTVNSSGGGGDVAAKENAGSSARDKAIGVDGVYSELN